MALKKGQEKNLILKKQLTLMTHPFYWEQEIKKRLGYVKEGEMVYKITSLL